MASFAVSRLETNPLAGRHCRCCRRKAERDAITRAYRAIRRTALQSDHKHDLARQVLCRIPAYLLPSDLELYGPFHLIS